ncbi:uncharacterized protein [Littorina saxatilis]|uniref:Uncharacterized protein n=1 Tax=Littorina saxatilis TaxID=31220 RepID=A0AAN9BIM4_9CAEN
MWICTVAEFSIVNDYDGWIDWTLGNGTHLPHEHQDIVPQKTALSNSTMSLFNFTSQLQLILTEPDTDFTLVCEIRHRLHEVISRSSLPFNVKIKAKATNYSQVTTAIVSVVTNSTREALLQVGKSRQLPDSRHRTLKGLFSTVSMQVLIAVVGIVDASCLVIVFVVRRNAMSLTTELDEVILRADKKLRNLRAGTADQRQTSNKKGMSKTESSASFPASAVSTAEGVDTSTTARIY